MKQTALKGLLLLLLLVCLADGALAHSTKGRKKVDLDVDRPTVDDFAFFMEGYVLQELYRNREPKWKNRYYVKEFKGVKLDEKQAVVGFITLDAKTNGNFADSMRFERGPDGIWYYPAANGNKLKVHTYVTTAVYYSKKYGRVLPVIGLAGSTAGLVLLVALRRRHLAQSAGEGQAPSWSAAIVDGQCEDRPENADKQQVNG